MRRCAVALGVSCVFAGCETQPPASDPGSSPLIDASAWRTTETAAADPARDHRPAQVECPESAWREELGGIEVDTGECNYFSVTQPSLEPIAAGQKINLVAWWQTLAAESAATGHLAVFIGTELLYSENIAIPGPADTRDLFLDAPQAHPTGTPITLHVHNHGYNTWNFETLAIHR